jgi:hypothetical protein
VFSSGELALDLGALAVESNGASSDSLGGISSEGAAITLFSAAEEARTAGCVRVKEKLGVVEETAPVDEAGLIDELGFFEEVECLEPPA